ARSKGLILSPAICPEAHGKFQGDPIRLRQVLVNLIGNAVKVTEQGQGRGTASIAAESDFWLKLLFEVENAGLGLSDDANERLFEPFVQADGSITRKYGGTGLGLAISKQLIELMGGQVGVESQAGAGSRFWFTARLYRMKSSAASSQPGPDLAAGV